MKNLQQIQKKIPIPSTNNFVTQIKVLIFFGCVIVIIASFFTTTTLPFNLIYVNNISINNILNSATSFHLPPPPLPPPPPPPLPSPTPPPPTPTPPSPPPPPPPPPPRPRVTLIHSMEDEELLRVASLLVKKNVNNDSRMMKSRTPPKVAFMFLVRGELPLAPLWDLFFKGHQGFYSIYVHASPTYDHTYSNDSVFYGRRIPSKPVNWGHMNMVEAERRLLASALLDPSNQRFVLHSETCIPLFDFPTIYSYLINSTKSYIQVYDEKGATGRGRYDRHMSPQIDLSQWRKGSQWFEMDRELAENIILDRTYFPVFKNYCNNKCYGDEHYLPTYVAIKYWEKNSNRTITWVDWSIVGPHPGKFERPRVTIDFLQKLRNDFSCEYNGEKTNICYLFARKFMPSSLTRLLRFGPKVFNYG